MDRFEAMRTLLAAIDGGSLSAASRNLGVPLPTVSRRVADLEAQLGAQLLVRTSRKLLLTEAGAAYAVAARRLLDDLSEAERAASGEYRLPRGELLVTAPIMFGKLHVAPIVHQFLLAYPDVSVRLLLSDGVLDIIEQHVDVAIRIGRLPDSSLVARRAGEISWMVVGAPDYLARRGHPRSVADIAHHDCIAFEGRERGREWPFLVDGKPTITVIKPRFSVNTADAVIDGAAAGLGLACLMSYQTAKSVRDGTLLPVLLKHQPPPIPVHVVHAPQALPPLKLRAFLDFVTPRLTKTLSAVKDSFTPRRSQRQK